MRSRIVRAFTLVELLVVIGIIAVLISILLPAMAKARDQATRVRCLSGLHQLHLAFMEYASHNRDQVPIGYVHGYKQMNYMIWSNTSQQYVLFGLLWESKVVRTPEVLYCLARTDPYNGYKLPDNPWPPGENPALPTRSSYAVRPEVNWGYPPTASAAANNNGGKLPRLSKMKNRAILADVLSDSDDMTTSHKNGANVLYGHGGASWVPQIAFWNDLKGCNPIFDTTYNNSILNYDAQGTARGVWGDLDAGQWIKPASGPAPR